MSQGYLVKAHGPVDFLDWERVALLSWEYPRVVRGDAVTCIESFVSL